MSNKLKKEKTSYRSRQLIRWHDWYKETHGECWFVKHLNKPVECELCNKGTKR